MDNRYKKINRLLSAYSKGDFDKAIPLSGKLDGLDAIISGINMLGEELKAVTISRDYFNNIFNTVSDMVLLVDSRGIIRDLNKAVYHQLGYSKTELSGKPVSCLQTTGNKSLSTGLLKEVRSGKGIMQMDTFFKDIHHKLIPVQITVTVMVDPSRKIHILITAKDNTGRIQNENAVIRAIIDAQEKERQRIAKDIHDSLGQQLSAIKFYIGALAEKCKDVGQRKNLLVSNTALVKVISEIRNICFDLVPSTLGEFGLWQAVKELCHQPEYKGKLQFILKEEPDFPSLPTNMEIDIFRVIQEFITNALNHGKASAIWIRSSHQPESIDFLLRDNGTGFDTERYPSSGRGLQNAQSRIKSHGGEIKIISAPRRGVLFKIMVPLIQ